VHATFPPEAARLLADEDVDQPADAAVVEPLPPPRSSAAAGPT
jgi:hypothetical protein